MTEAHETQMDMWSVHQAHAAAGWFTSATVARLGGLPRDSGMQKDWILFYATFIYFGSYQDPGVLAERFDMKIGLLRPIRPQVLRPNPSPKRSDMVFVGKFVLDYISDLATNDHCPHYKCNIET